MRHIGIRLALTCSLVLLSACSERVSFLAPKFQMGSNNAQALVVSPDGEVHESGKLTVSIRGFLDTLTKKRRLLATLADVEKVVVEVSASGLSFSQTLDKTAIASGTTSATFTGIPEGAATVTMKAYNLTNQLIGQASKATSVTAGATTTVEIQLQLDPTYTQPSTGGGTTTGSITANGTIIDGPVIEGTPPPPSGTLISGIHPDYTLPPPGHFDLDSLGHAWQVVFDASYQVSLIQIATSGTELKRFPISTPSVNRVFVDSTDAIWTFSEGSSTDTNATRFNSEGTKLVELPDLHFDRYWGNPIVEDSQGHFWVNAVEGLFKYMSDGTLLGQAAFEPTSGTFTQINPAAVAMDGDGHLWVLNHGWESSYPKEAWLTKHGPDGIEIGRYPVPVPPFVSTGSANTEDSQLEIASDGTIWYSYQYSDQLYRVGPDGNLLGTFNFTGNILQLEIDPGGYLWVGTTTNLHKLSQTGTTLMTVPLSQDEYVADVPFGLSTSHTGIWVIGDVNVDLIVVSP